MWLLDCGVVLPGDSLSISLFSVFSFFFFFFLAFLLLLLDLSLFSFIFGVRLDLRGHLFISSA